MNYTDQHGNRFECYISGVTKENQIIDTKILGTYTYSEKKQKFMLQIFIDDSFILNSLGDKYRGKIYFETFEDIIYYPNILYHPNFCMWYAEILKLSHEEHRVNIAEVISNAFSTFYHRITEIHSNNSSNGTTVITI